MSTAVELIAVVVPELVELVIVVVVVALVKVVLVHLIHLKEFLIGNIKCLQYSGLSKTYSSVPSEAALSCQYRYVITQH